MNWKPKSPEYEVPYPQVEYDLYRNNDPASKYKDVRWPLNKGRGRHGEFPLVVVREHFRSLGYEVLASEPELPNLSGFILVSYPGKRRKNHPAFLQMERFFSKDIITQLNIESDQAKIDQALEVLGFAEEIMEKENGHPQVVIAAATLYGIGIDGSGKKARMGELPHGEKFPAVRDILERSGAKDELIEEVCRILEGHEHPGKEDTVNGRIVHDAYQLACLKRESEGGDKAEVKQSIHEHFLTAAAKEMEESFGAH